MNVKLCHLVQQMLSHIPEINGQLPWRFELNWCRVYLDDIIIFSQDAASHIERLEAVFKKLAKAGLKLKPSKCEFFKKRIKYLGHICL